MTAQPHSCSSSKSGRAPGWRRDRLGPARIERPVNGLQGGGDLAAVETGDARGRVFADRDEKVLRLAGRMLGSGVPS